jgi:hypothetical protein
LPVSATKSRRVMSYLGMKNLRIEVGQIEVVCWQRCGPPPALHKVVSIREAQWGVGILGNMERSDQAMPFGGEAKNVSRNFVQSSSGCDPHTANA